MPVSTEPREGLRRVSAPFVAVLGVLLRVAFGILYVLFVVAIAFTVKRFKIPFITVVATIGGWLGFWFAGWILHAHLGWPSWIHIQLETVIRVAVALITAMVFVLVTFSVLDPPAVGRFIGDTRRRITRAPLSRGSNRLLRAIGRRLSHTPLWTAIVLAVLAGVGLALLFNWAIGEFAGLKSEQTPRIEVTRTALAGVAGIGGAVALVVAYRRQRDVEQGRFVERFGAAAAQLGNQDVAVRIAGVYAMAGVADESSNFGRRQQCIDVLCGYLRLPYDSQHGTNHLAEQTRHTGPQIRSIESTYRFRQNDREVRQTIVRAIAARLVRDAEICWSQHDFDFTGVLFEEVDFGSAVFDGRHTNFNDATFCGNDTNFESATFSGEFTSFARATFSGETATFAGATFSGKVVSFAGATFSGETSVFGATSSGGNIIFGAIFGGETTNFEGTTFGATVTSFDGAKFCGKGVMFDGAIFRGETTIFGATSGEEASVLASELNPRGTHFGAEFTGKFTSFRHATFTGKVAHFNRARFWCDMTRFDAATFSGESTNFEKTKFDTVIVFDGVAFCGGPTSFREASFKGERASFMHPRAWSNVTFDWDGNPTTMPDGVKPRPPDWPPVTVAATGRTTD